jgi:deoxyribonuclease-4
MNRSRVGRHISIGAGFNSCVKFASSRKCEIFQLFLGSPQIIKTRKRDNSELVKFYKELHKYDMVAVIHGSYTLNFCHPKDTKIYKDSVISLKQDLDASIIMGALGVVIHMGKNLPKYKLTYNEAIQNYYNGVKEVLDNTDKSSIIILETGASQGNEICSDIPRLGKLLKMFHENENYKKRVKICIDTCHVWSTGHDISTKDKVLEFMKLVELHISWDNVICIHLNDSKVDIGAKVDRHADIGFGKIPVIGLKTFAKYCSKLRIPLVLETGCNTYYVDKKDDKVKKVDDIEQLDIIKKWIK